MNQSLLKAFNSLGGLCDWFVCYWLCIKASIIDSGLRIFPRSKYICVFFYRKAVRPLWESNPFPTASARKTGGHFLVGECCWHVAAAFYIFTSLTWFPLPNECIECSESQKLTASSDRTAHWIPGIGLGFKFKYLDMERLNKRNSIYGKQNHNPSIIHQEANTCRQPGTEWNGRNFIDTPTCTPRYRYNGAI